LQSSHQPPEKLRPVHWDRFEEINVPINLNDIYQSRWAVAEFILSSGYPEKIRGVSNKFVGAALQPRFVFRLALQIAAGPAQIGMQAKAAPTSPMKTRQTKGIGHFFRFFRTFLLGLFAFFSLAIVYPNNCKTSTFGGIRYGERTFNIVSQNPQQAHLNLRAQESIERVA
jgi:hypothetical protein